MHDVHQKHEIDAAASAAAAAILQGAATVAKRLEAVANFKLASKRKASHGNILATVLDFFNVEHSLGGRGYCFRLLIHVAVVCFGPSA